MKFLELSYNGERFIPDECNGEMRAEHYQRYYLVKQLSRGKKILDAACGEGYGSSLLSAVAEEVVGLDIDKDAICCAKKKYEKNNLSFRVGSIENLPFENKCFDIVVSFETIEHVGEKIQKKFLDEILRVLKDDGVLIMSTPNKRIYTDLVHAENKYHIKEFYSDEYITFLRHYFKNIECICQYPYTGYFMSWKGEKFQNIRKIPCTSMDDSRYIIAICSNVKNEYSFDTEKIAVFDNSMYYHLYKMVHKQEQQLIQIKQEAEDFGKRKEEDIIKQKKYIFHLEKDNKQQREYIKKLEKEDELKKQKEYILHLEKDNRIQREYIEKTEKDLQKQREYIEKTEKDLQKQREYIIHLESDIEQQKKYIIHMEEERGEQQKYSIHMERDIGELKEYVNHLERDISELKRQIEKQNN